MKKMILGLFATVLMIAGVGGVMLSQPAHAVICANGKPADSIDKCSEWSDGTNGQGIASNKNMMDTLNTVLNVVVGLIGFVSVAVIVLGGISFATSQGDTARTTKARNTILYGVVGLVVALLAFAIVNFVLTNVFSE